MSEEKAEEKRVENTEQKEESGDQNDGKRSRSRDNRGQRDRRRRRSRSRDRRDRDGSRDRDRRKRGDRDRRRRSKRSESPPPRPRTPSPDPMELARLRAEEEERQRQRDENTVFVYQIHPKVDERDLFEFFSAVGKVTDIRLIRDQRTQKSKGLCYIEFGEKSSVMKAVSLTGQQLGGFPITVTVTQAEKNRVAEQNDGGSMRLYVGSLHFNVTEDDLKPVFETFGPLDFIDLHKDPATGVSRGFGFVQYRKAADAKTALTNLNGLQIAGRPIKVGMVDSKTEGSSGGNVADLDDNEGGGLALTANSRAMLMQRLNRDQIQMPNTAQASKPQDSGVIAAKQLSVPKIQPTECVVIRNMFNPTTESDPEFHLDIKEDVEDEVNKYGAIKHIFVDKDNPKGVVYVRVDSASTGEKVVKSLHGRWFASRQIVAECVIPATYESKFPESKK